MTKVFQALKGKSENPKFVTSLCYLQKVSLHISYMLRHHFFLAPRSV